jgi:hypothetical protein
MHFPSFARTLMATAGFEVHISGKRKEVLLSTCDRLFTDSRNSGEVSVRVGTTTLRLNLANSSERLLYYAPQNLLRSYRNSPFFTVISRFSRAPGLFVDIEQIWVCIACSREASASMRFFLSGSLCTMPSLPVTLQRFGRLWHVLLAIIPAPPTFLSVVLKIPEAVRW